MMPRRLSVAGKLHERSHDEGDTPRQADVCRAVVGRVEIPDLPPTDVKLSELVGNDETSAVRVALYAGLRRQILPTLRVRHIGNDSAGTSILEHQARKER